MADGLRIEFDTEAGVVTVSQATRDGYALVPPVEVQVPVDAWILAACQMIQGKYQDQGRALTVAGPSLVKA